jgi:hypothetical protein
MKILLLACSPITGFCLSFIRIEALPDIKYFIESVAISGE